MFRLSQAALRVFPLQNLLSVSPNYPIFFQTPNTICLDDCVCGYANLRQPGLPADEPMGLSEDVAAKLALGALEYERELSFGVPHCPRHESSLNDFPYLVFNDIGRMLFRGVLKDRVYLEWGSSSLDFHCITSAPGIVDSRITISLSPRDKERSKATTLATLIHHMTHAYFIVCCGSKEDRTEEYVYDLTHSKGYCALLYIIMDVFKPLTIDSVPNLFNCFPEPLPSRSKGLVVVKVRGKSCCPWYL